MEKPFHAVERFAPTLALSAASDQLVTDRSIGVKMNRGAKHAEHTVDATGMKYVKNTGSGRDMFPELPHADYHAIPFSNRSAAMETRSSRWSRNCA